MSAGQAGARSGEAGRDPAAEGGGPAPDPRTAEIAPRLAAVRERIRSAAVAAGRRPDEVTLVVVTKDKPAEDVRRLVALGVRDVGESRQQQLRDKRGELADLTRASGLRWHLVGRLQRNKARAVARDAVAVHSVDDRRLLAPLAAGAADAGRTLDCLVQVSLDGDPARGGVLAGDVPALAQEVAAVDGLALRGVMAVAPLSADPDEAFGQLRTVAERVRAAHPDAAWVSAGMSGDLEAAVRNGATHVRVGAAILGSRQVTR